MGGPTWEVVHETKESSLQKFPTDSWLAQLSEHDADDPEVVSSNPTRGNFWRNLFFCCVALDLSDNLTEMCIVKNSIVVSIRDNYCQPSTPNYDLMVFVIESIHSLSFHWTRTLVPVSLFKMDIKARELAEKTQLLTCVYKGSTAGHTCIQIITAELVSWLSLFSRNDKEIDVKS